MSTPPPPPPAPAQAGPVATAPPQPQTGPMTTAPPPPPPPPNPLGPASPASWRAGAGRQEPPGPEPDISLFKPIEALGNLVRRVLLLQMLFAMAVLVSNGFLIAVLPPTEPGRTRDTFIWIEEHMEEAFWVLGGLGALAGVLALVWLYLAYVNQKAFGTEGLSLPAPLLFALCLVPLVNVVVITRAFGQLLRTADRRLPAYVGTSWKSIPFPSAANRAWFSSLIGVVAVVGFTLMVDAHVGEQATTEKEARTLFAYRMGMMLLVVWALAMLRKLVDKTTDMQDRAARARASGVYRY